MSVIIITRPRAVIRQVLSDPLMLAKLDQNTHSYIASVLAKPDDEWTRYEFRKLHQLFGDCDD